MIIVSEAKAAAEHGTAVQIANPHGTVRAVLGLTGVPDMLSDSSP
jgi:hypothetical protein